MPPAFQIGILTGVIMNLANVKEHTTAISGGKLRTRG